MLIDSQILIRELRKLKRCSSLGPHQDGIDMCIQEIEDMEKESEERTGDGWAGTDPCIMTPFEV